MPRKVVVSAERARMEAEEICAILWLKCNDSEELRLRVLSRAEIYARMLREFERDERARLSRC